MTPSQKTTVVGLPAWVAGILVSTACALAIIWAIQGELTLDVAKDLIIVVSPAAAPYIAAAWKKRKQTSKEKAS